MKYRIRPSKIIRVSLWAYLRLKTIDALTWLPDKLNLETDWLSKHWLRIKGGSS